MKSNHVGMGAVILLSEDDCKLLGDVPVGEYIVEDARDSGGWCVFARKLDGAGKYCVDELIVKFHQCPGYAHSLLSVNVVRYLRRIFI